MNLLHSVVSPPGPGPHPTVIALHGHGANALDLLGISQTLHSGLLWICPQAEFRLEGFYGFTWFHFDRGDPQRESESARVAGGLRTFIDDASERYPVDRERTALLGFSQGGMLAYRLALSDPGRFAGLAALSTAFPAEAAEGIEPSDELRHFPVLVQHGSEDPMIAVDRARESRQRLEQIGVDLEYREYPMGHQIGAESANDLAVWLSVVLKLDGSEAGEQGQA